MIRHQLLYPLSQKPDDNNNPKQGGRYIYERLTEFKTIIINLG
jgi:hypothetical protein